MKKIILIASCVLAVSCGKESSTVIMSGYSSAGNPDVKIVSVDNEGNTGKISDCSIGNNPSFFTFGDEGLVYFVNEVDSFRQAKGGGITSMKYDSRSNSLSEVGSINQGGGGPCHIALSADRHYLITANYGSGSISVVKLGANGIPEKVTDVIFYGERSHPHMTLYNPRLGLYYISDLGLDRIHQLKLDTAIGRLIDANVPYIRCDSGSGPRHMAIDRNGANLYVINELNSTISVFDILNDTAEIKQTLRTLPENFSGVSYCADLHLASGGRKIYGSNRGDNSIVTFTIGSQGMLSSPGYNSCGGDWPRNFALSPSGKFILVANQRSGKVSFIPLGSKSRDEVMSEIPINAPACVQFLR